MGYILNFQGYYGFGDMQINRMIDMLEIFYSKEGDQLVLNNKGHKAIEEQHDFSSEFIAPMIFGGVNKIDFKFSKIQNKLIKII